MVPGSMRHRAKIDVDTNYCIVTPENFASAAPAFGCGRINVEIILQDCRSDPPEEA